MQIIDVGQVTAYIKDLLETDPILSDLWLRGEITSFFESSAGHCYFTLSGDGCQIKAVLFKGHRWSVKELPRQGDEIIAHGNVSIYPDQGQYQLYVDFLAPEGTGLAQLQFEELYRRLEAEGLFDLSRKRALPELPNVIGVVTSAQGAVWHDITTVISRRYPVARIVRASSPVQGSEAPARLREGLEKLYAAGICDVIIIARGGGSPEELAVFNDEMLARTIFRSPVPIVSAIGHETDTTIADLVADMRAPTPSAAAELVVPDQREILAALANRLFEARDSIGDRLELNDQLLQRSVSTLKLRSPGRRIDRAHQSLDLLRLRSATAVRRDLERRKATLDSRRASLISLSPDAVLKRGFAAIEDADTGQRLMSVASISQRTGNISIRMQDGVLTASPVREHS